MYILALETTGPHASVAVIDEKGETVEKINGGTLNHLENLMPMVRELLDENKIEKDEIEAVAASAGPGSFTGIRIGVTTARTLSDALDIGAISVPTLLSFAWSDMEYKGIFAPLIDARRNQVYAGAFRWKDNVPETVVEPAPYMIDEFMDLLTEVEDEIMFFGDGIRVHGEKLLETFDRAILAPQENRLQRALYVARAALYMKKRGGIIKSEELLPEYMRKAEAERKLEEKLKNESASDQTG